MTVRAAVRAYNACYITRICHKHNVYHSVVVDALFRVYQLCRSTLYTELCGWARAKKKNFVILLDVRMGICTLCRCLCLLFLMISVSILSSIL